jgi:hypothetical protein
MYIAEIQIVMLKFSYIIIICAISIFMMVKTKTISNNFISIKVRQNISNVDINGNIVSIIVDLDPTDVSNVTDTKGNAPVVNYLGNLVLNNRKSGQSFDIDEYSIGRNGVIKDITGSDIIINKHSIDKYVKNDDKIVLQEVSVVSNNGTSTTQKININIRDISLVVPKVTINDDGTIVVERTPGSNLSLQDEYDYIYYYDIKKSIDGKTIRVKIVPRRLFCMKNPKSKYCSTFKNSFCTESENSVNSSLCTDSDFSAIY